MSDKIELTDTIQDVIVKMAQGNPGALIVLAQIIEADPKDGLMTLMHADDMGLRGPSLWIAYKDFAGGDLAVLCQALKDRSAELVATVKAQGEMAVVGGAS